MGMLVLLLGQSGSGKSSSLRNFTPEEVGVLNVAGKPLPFKNKLQVVGNAKYETIAKALQRATKPSYVIDDAGYLITFENFAKATVKGYEKFTELAVNYYNLLRIAAEKTPDDCIIYFVMHEDEDSNTGRIKPKTIGRMLDEKLCIEGVFSIVLRSIVTVSDREVSYLFETQSNGYSPAKSPIGMLPPVMDNDLKAVDDAIRKYYGWIKEGGEDKKNNLNTNKELRSADVKAEETAAAVEVAVKEAEKRAGSDETGTIAEPEFEFVW